MRLSGAFCRPPPVLEGTSPRRSTRVKIARASAGAAGLGVSAETDPILASPDVEAPKSPFLAQAPRPSIDLIEAIPVVRVGEHLALITTGVDVHPLGKGLSCDR